MTSDLDPLDRFLPDAPDRPLDDAQVSSNLLNRSFSEASAEASANLLAKALRRIESGEDDRAGAFILRALQLPYDDFEEMRPAPWSAHMLLFDSISDDVESCEPGDQGWLDRAESLIGRFGDPADLEIRGCLRSFRDDAFVMTGPERRRLKTLTEGIPLDAEPFATVPADDASLAAAIGDLLRVLIEHHRLTSTIGRGRPGH
jgi:hypothetical protein